MDITPHDKCVLDALDGIVNTVNLRRVFLLLTQMHFSTPANYGPLRKTLADLVWSPDVASRTLNIQLQHDFDERGVVNILPSIFFGVGNTDFDNEVVAAEAGYNDDNSSHKIVMKATTVFQWVCVANTADLAGNIAETCFSFFANARPWLIKTLGFRYFILKQIGQVILAKLPENREYYRVDIRGTLDYNHVMSVSQESHRLKKVSMALSPAPSTESLPSVI